jgi:putative flippase GtrA
MKKNDIIAVVILGEIVAVFLNFVIKGLNLNFGFPVFILYIALPILALVMNAIFYLIGKRIPIFFQFAKFITVGLANTAVDFGVLNLLMWSSGVYEGKTIILFNVISFLIAAIHSYIWNKLWTFSFKGKSNVANQFLQFIIVSLVGVLINSGIVYIITTWVSSNASNGVWVNIAKLVATVVSLVWNFIGYKFIVFKKKDEQPSSNLS